MALSSPTDAKKMSPQNKNAKILASQWATRVNLSKLLKTSMLLLY